MVRTFLLFGFASALVAVAWLRLEELPVSWREVTPLVALALVPTAAAVFVRSRLGVAAVLAGTTLFAASAAFEIPLAETRPGDPQRDFFGPVLDGIRQGFLDFYETKLPFLRLDFPLMHSVLLLAIFGFCALTGLFIAARKPVAAALVLVAGIGWPATLYPGDSPLAQGAVALAGVLAVLFLLRGGQPGRGIAQAAAAGVVLVALAAVASTSDAVAKGAFVPWQSWDPYDRPDEPVSVSYVWNSHYLGIDFPKKRTTVLRVKVSGTRRSLYWRATTLDEYTGQGWNESLDRGPAEEQEEIDELELDPLLPQAAREEKNWVRQDVTIEALRDNHLLASAQPVRWKPPSDTPVQRASNGALALSRTLTQGRRYTVWSYIPRVNPSELVQVKGEYPESVERYLEILQTVSVPEWGDEARRTEMARFFADNEGDFLIDSHRELYEIAVAQTGDARNPYEAAFLLEAWFRQGGGFAYDESPPPAVGGEPPLVAFVTRDKRGYCQHYAGAMAIMLRLLGIPSRVAAGFTSGQWNADDKEWVVTDHNAHTWVEVFFPGHGWLSFDPTPGRGQLFASYSYFGAGFNPGDAADIGLGRLSGLTPQQREAIEGARGQPGRPGTPDLGGTGSGGAVGVVTDKGPSLLLLVLIVLGGAYSAVVALKASRRTLRFATTDTRELATACRRDLVGFLADQGVEVPSSSTLPEIGAALDRHYAVEGDHLVRDLTLARFGPPAEAPDALRRARRELRTVRKQLRRALGVTSRLRGSASLRSLSA
ncbi:MAG: transglutaminaseTgpA domain-containing protein [Gaiellaceae bacterium]